MQKGELKDIQQHLTILAGFAKSRRTKSCSLQKYFKQNELKSKHPLNQTCDYCTSSSQSIQFNKSEMWLFYGCVREHDQPGTM